MHQSKLFSLPLLKKEHLAQNTYSFFFDRSGVPFEFLAGQYIRMTVPHESPDDRGTSRYFTIASSPHEKNYLMITTKLYKSSFKESLHSLSPGEGVQFFGPMGRFVLDETDMTPRIFIAGGVGVTPFHSMIQYVASKQLAIPITLIVTFSKNEDVIFYEELRALSMRHKQINIHYLIAEREGRLTEQSLKPFLSQVGSSKHSIVGSPSLVAETKTLLMNLKIPEENIVTEDFTGY